MRKTIILLFFITSIILALSTYAGAEIQSDVEFTPETAYAEICSILGEPQSIVSRKALNSTIGEAAEQDQFMVIDTIDSLYFVVNRSDKPDNMFLWFIKPVSDDDYKTVLTILHSYSEGYGISANNRCLYLKMEVGTPLDFYCSDTEIEPDGTNILSNVDELITCIVTNIHPKLTDWVNSELISK